MKLLCKILYVYAVWAIFACQQHHSSCSANGHASLLEQALGDSIGNGKWFVLRIWNSAQNDTTCGTRNLSTLIVANGKQLYMDAGAYFISYHDFAQSLVEEQNKQGRIGVDDCLLYERISRIWAIERDVFIDSIYWAWGIEGLLRRYIGNDGRLHYDDEKEAKYLIYLFYQHGLLFDCDSLRISFHTTELERERLLKVLEKRSSPIDAVWGY